MRAMETKEATATGDIVFSDPPLGSPFPVTVKSVPT
jgi:hypothetical protein